MKSAIRYRSRKISFFLFLIFSFNNLFSCSVCLSEFISKLMCSILGFAPKQSIAGRRFILHESIDAECSTESHSAFQKSFTYPFKRNNPQSCTDEYESDDAGKGVLGFEMYGYLTCSHPLESHHHRIRPLRLPLPSVPGYYGGRAGNLTLLVSGHGKCRHRQPPSHVVRTSFCCLRFIQT